VVRAGFRNLLASELDLMVVGEAATGEEVVTQTKALAPNVILFDLAMPRKLGIKIIAALRQMCSFLALRIIRCDKGGSVRGCPVNPRPQWLRCQW
jgi:DNA-binding NarL/FixJ family response regulator